MSKSEIIYSFLMICFIAFLIFAGFRICRDYEKGLMDHVEQKLEDRKDRDRIRENYNYHIRMEGRT